MSIFRVGLLNITIEGLKRWYFTLLHLFLWCLRGDIYSKPCYWVLLKAPQLLFAVHRFRDDFFLRQSDDEMLCAVVDPGRVDTGVESSNENSRFPGIEKSSTLSNSSYFYIQCIIETLAYLLTNLLLMVVQTWYTYLVMMFNFPISSMAYCQGSSSPASSNDCDSGSAKHCGTREGLRIYSFG